MNMIRPIAPHVPNPLEFHANGKVVRVFDSNADGALVPVEFDLLGDGSSFMLRGNPFGSVYVETESIGMRQPPSAEKVTS